MTTQQTPIAFSGDIPKFYDSYLGPMFFEPYAIDMADRIGKIAPQNLLELAAGTGRLTRLLPSVLPLEASIVATDINPAMVTFGNRKIHDEKIQWLEVDAVSLPFGNDSFDCVAAQFGVMFYSDRIKAFKEALRVLKSGGTFIFNCWDSIKNNPMPLIANEALQHFFPVDTPAFYSVPFSYFDEKVIISDLAKSGFDEIKIEVVKLNGYSKSPADAAKGLIQGTPTVTAIEDRDADKLPLILEYLEGKISNRFGKEALNVPLQALVVSCKKK